LNVLVALRDSFALRVFGLGGLFGVLVDFFDGWRSLFGGPRFFAGMEAVSCLVLLAFLCCAHALGGGFFNSLLGIKMKLYPQE